MTEEHDIPRIEAFLKQEFATVLAVDKDSIRVETPLLSLRVDSMRFVEILVIIEREYGVRLIKTGLTREDLMNIASLARCIAKAREVN